MNKGIIILIIINSIIWLSTILSFVFGNEKICRRMNKGYGEFKIKNICKANKQSGFEQLMVAIMVTLITLMCY